MSSGRPQKIATLCPHCGKRFTTPAENEGKQVRCPVCTRPFAIAPTDARSKASVGSAASVGASAAAGAPRCVICQSRFGPGQPTTTCPDCGTTFHEECWRYNNGCGVYGCSQAPPTEGLSSLEVPPSYWEREEKLCPQCGKTILASAVRCRHCGAMFSSATPQDTDAYSARERIKAQIPAVRTASIWLLIFSLVPCTAPFAAVVGGIWYFRHRETISALPALNAALCKIAVGVAWAQTGMLILGGILSSVAQG